MVEAVRVVMKASQPVGRSLVARWRGGALALIRPGAEVALLAGVAIGCAQIGWRIAAPELPDLAVSEAAPEAAQEAVSTGFRSPFAPMHFADAESNDYHADLSGIRVVGVRMAPNADDSGAILILGDGAQRSFLVGYEIVDGVRLHAVESDHIVVSLADETEQTLTLERTKPAGPSLALALLGRPQPEVQPAGAVMVAASPAWTGEGAAETVSMPLGREQDVTSWFIATGGQLELRNGQPYAWRAANAAPRQVREAGVQPGDLILSINGAGPDSGQSRLISAASSGPITLEIERKTGQRVRLQVSRGL